MPKFSRKSLIAASLAAVVTIPAVAHIERTEPLQSLRQSYFAIVGMTFGPMGDMVKGTMHSLPHGLMILRLCQKYRSSEALRPEVKKERLAPNRPYGKIPTTSNKNWRTSAVKPQPSQRPLTPVIKLQRSSSSSRQAARAKPAMTTTRVVATSTKT